MNTEIKERIEQVRRGEVPEGYSQQRALLYPLDWGNPVPLNAILRENKDRNEDGRFDKANVLSVSGEMGVVNQIDLLGRSYAGVSVADYHVVETGNLVYTKSPLKQNPFGIIKLNKGQPGIVSTLYAVYHCNHPVTGLYLDYFFSVDSYVNNYLKPIVKKGAKNDMKVNNEDVLDGLIAIPSLPEQQKIAEILTHCDKVIDLKKQLIEEKRSQKKWLMQNLLNPDSGVRLPGFEESVWNSSSLGELFTFGASLSASRDQLGNEGILYLHYGDIHANEMCFVDVKNGADRIPRLLTDSPSEKIMLRDGDVVFVDASEDYEGVSKYVVISNPDNLPFISGLHTIPARSRSRELLTAFKRYCFQPHDFRSQMAYYANGMKVYGVNKNDLSKVTISYPSHHEQSAIASVLSSADLELNLLEQELAHWQTKKKALMQLLLTGIVRVTPSQEG